MKKIIGGIKKNIFYISLIAGMALLVTALGLYNAKMNSKEKNIQVGQKTSEITEGNDTDTKETISGKEKNSSIGTYQDNLTDEASMADNRKVDASTDDGEGASAIYEAEYKESAKAAENELHFDPGKCNIEWPLVGNVIIPYSMDTTVYYDTLEEYKVSPAMIIEASEGDEVKAVYECKVSEVSSSPELGNYVMLDLGDGYAVTLGQLSEVSVRLGDKLKAGQVVGTVGQPSRFYSNEGVNLYFAIEKDGQPVDPNLLIQ